MQENISKILKTALIELRFYARNQENYQKIADLADVVHNAPNIFLEENLQKNQFFLENLKKEILNFEEKYSEEKWKFSQFLDL